MWVLERAALLDGRMTFDPDTLEVRVFQDAPRATEEFRSWSRSKLGPEQYVMLSVYLRQRRRVCAIKARGNVRARLERRFPEIRKLP